MGCSNFSSFFCQFATSVHNFMRFKYFNTCRSNSIEFPINTNVLFKQLQAIVCVLCCDRVRIVNTERKYSKMYTRSRATNEDTDQTTHAYLLVTVQLCWRRNTVTDDKEEMPINPYALSLSSRTLHEIRFTWLNESLY